MIAGVVLLTESLLAIALLVTFVRLVLGPSIADRVVALDVIAVIGVGFSALLTIDSGRTVFLDISLVLALIAFLGTVAFARYLEKRGRP